MTVSRKIPEIRRSRRPTRGVALVIVIVLTAICLTLFGIWARTTVGQQRRMANWQTYAQAERLAEAGVTRARARRDADPAYREEVWKVTPAEIGGRQSGEVRILVTEVDGSQETRIEAVATYPLESMRRAKVSKVINVHTPSSENER